MTIAAATAEQNNRKQVIAETRSGMYGLLARIYRQEPTKELFALIDQPYFQEALIHAGVRLEQNLPKIDQDNILLDLATEYTRLFIGPGKHISPHESVHINSEGGLWGEATVAVNQFIKSIGFEFQVENSMIPDHISVEFELMQRLAHYEAQAWATGDEQRAIDCLAVEHRFLEQHLIKWVPQFCEQVITQTELSFYREMAKLTRDFIEADM